MIQARMAIAGTATIELEVCDARANAYVLNKPFMLLIKNRLDATKSQSQDESLLYPSQTRDYGSIVDHIAHIHGVNQRIYTSNKNIPLKYDGKYMHVTVTKAINEEQESLQVMQLTGSIRFTPQNVNKE